MLGRFTGLLLSAEDTPKGSQIEQVSLVGADDQADVGHEQHDQNLKEASGMLFGNGIPDYESKQVSAENSQHAADGCPNQAFQANTAKLPFEEDNSHTDDSADDTGVELRRKIEGLN